MSARAEKAVKPRRSQNTTTTSTRRPSSTLSSPVRSTSSATCGARKRFSRLDALRALLRDRQLGRHLVEAARQPLELVAGRELDAVVELPRADARDAILQQADGTDHALGQPPRQPGGQHGAGDEQRRRAQQRRVERPEGLGQRLLDDDAPVDARDRRHCRQHRLARDVAAGRRLARPVEDGGRAGAWNGRWPASSARSTRLMSGWATRRPGSSSTKASPVRPTLIAEITSQMNLRLTSATATPTDERLPATAIIMKGSEPSWNLTGPNHAPLARAPSHRRPEREIGAAVDPVQPDARHEQPFAAGGVDQGQALDGRDLAQQAERVEPMPARRSLPTTAAARSSRAARGCRR